MAPKPKKKIKKNWEAMGVKRKREKSSEHFKAGQEHLKYPWPS